MAQTKAKDGSYINPEMVHILPHTEDKHGPDISLDMDQKLAQS